MTMIMTRAIYVINLMTVRCLQKINKFNFISDYFITMKHIQEAWFLYLKYDKLTDAM